LTLLPLIMANKNRKNRSGIVYSTNPDYQYQHGEETPAKNIDAQKQDLRVWLDKKARRGKQVTLVKGFKGQKHALKELEKFLKSKCGVGGSIKDGEIIIQGNHQDKVVDLLLSKGYQVKKAGG